MAELGLAPIATADRAGAADRVVREVRAALFRGELAPGAPLGEAGLAAGFDVSRNTVREALRVLRQQGLVEHHPHRGASVRTIDAGVVRDLHQAWELLEVAGIRAQRDGGAAALLPLEQGLAELRDLVGREDWVAASQRDLALHGGLVALTGNAELDAFFARIADGVRLVRAPSARRPDGGRAAAGAGALAAVLDALRSGDVVRAEEHCVGHLARCRQDALAALG